MTPGGAFRFYKPPCYKENVPEGSQSAQSAPSSTRVRAFRNTTPAELALKFKRPAEIPLPPRPPPPRAIPSTCPQPLKFHLVSTPSADPVKLGDCSNASLPRVSDSSASSAFANITSSDLIQSSEIPPAKKAVFRHDRVKMTWASMDEAKAWMEVEEQDKGFKFASKGTIPTHGAAVEWTMKFRYVCSRGASGGKKVYEKKTHQATKKTMAQRDTGCKCALRLTLYPDRVEGSYVAAHNHP